MKTFSTRQHYRTRLFLYTLLIVILGAALAGAGVLALMPSELGKGYNDVLATVQGIGNVLLRKVAMLYIAISLCIVMAMTLLHLFYSHRVAGPAFRLSREAVRLGQGNLAGNIRFRQKDNLTDMADSMNDVAGKYRARVDTIKGRLSVIETQSQAISDLMQQGRNGSELERAADELTANLRAMDKILMETRT